MNKKLYFGSNLKMYKNVRDTVEYLTKLVGRLLGEVLGEEGTDIGPGTE